MRNREANADCTIWGLDKSMTEQYWGWAKEVRNTEISECISCQTSTAVWLSRSCKRLPATLHADGKLALVLVTVLTGNPTWTHGRDTSKNYLA